MVLSFVLGMVAWAAVIEFRRCQRERKMKKQHKKEACGLEDIKSETEGNPKSNSELQSDSMGT